MDHIYAATAPNSSVVELSAPLPSVATCLLDHNFARPPSESPLFSNHAKQVQTPKVKRMANGKDGGQSVATKPSVKGAKRPRRHLRQKFSHSSNHKSSSPAEVSDEEDGFIPVATMASAPNSPAGKRSLLAEHLLAASTIQATSNLSLGSSSENLLNIDEDTNEGHEEENMTEHSSLTISQSSSEQRNDCPEEDKNVEAEAEKNGISSVSSHLLLTAGEQEGLIKKGKAGAENNNASGTNSSGTSALCKNNAWDISSREEKELKGKDVLDTDDLPLGKSELDCSNNHGDSETESQFDSRKLVKGDSTSKEMVFSAENTSSHIEKESEQVASSDSENINKQSAFSDKEKTDEQSAINDRKKSNNSEKADEQPESNNNEKTRELLNIPDIGGATESKSVQLERDQVQATANSAGTNNISDAFEPKVTETDHVKTTTGLKKMPVSSNKHRTIKISSPNKTISRTDDKSGPVTITVSIPEAVKLKKSTATIIKEQKSVSPQKDVSVSVNKVTNGCLSECLQTGEKTVKENNPDDTRSSEIPQTANEKIASGKESSSDNVQAEFCQAGIKRNSTEPNSENFQQELPRAGKKRTAKEANLDHPKLEFTPDELKCAAKKPAQDGSSSSLSGNQVRSSPESQLDLPVSKLLTLSGNSTPITTKKSAANKARFLKTDASQLPCDIAQYLIPLKEHKWKRELVLRGVYDELTSSGSKRKNPPADVYYFTPENAKLRSSVMIKNYLNEHPEIPLSVDNFTFCRMPISEEPWETVREAGKLSGRKSKVGSKGNVHQTPSQTSKIPKIKIMVGSSSENKATIVRVSPPPSKPLTSAKTVPRKASTVNRTVHRLSYEQDEDDIDDEDYDPWNEDQTPRWNKSRSIFHKRRAQKPSKSSSETEILIQSMPEPDIIIDRAEESPHVDASNVSKGEEPSTIQEPKSPQRMMLLPEDIKEETPDSDEEVAGKEKNNSTSSDIRTVHFRSTTAKKASHTKPTARKSTMPRIALRKPSNSKTKDLILSDGQLCSNSCPGLERIAPSLQCCICMCLFHHQCVNVDPLEKLPYFKCLRCKDIPAPQKKNWTPEIQVPALVVPPVTTSVSSTSSSCPSASSLIYLRSPLVPQSGVLGPPVASPYQSPFISVASSTVAPSQGQGSQPKTDAVQLLRNLACMRNSVPPLSAPARPNPVPPQLIRGASEPPPLRSSNTPLPPLHIRPPPRLTAAPGVMVSSRQPTSTTLTMFTNSSTSNSILHESSRSQPQPQMMTLPISLLSRLNLSLPLAVKLNNAQVVVPPSCIINSQDGLKVLLPPSTFPVPPDSNTKVSVTVSNNTITSTVGPVLTSTAVASKVIPHNNRLPLLASSSHGRTVSIVNKSLPGRVLSRQRRQQKNNDSIDFTQCTMHRLFGGFDCMLQIFGYLGLLDLLRASRVCRTWLQISHHRRLWQKVNLKGLHVKDWNKAADFMYHVGTQSVCFENLYCNTVSEWLSSWSQVSSCVSILTCLRSVEFSLVPSFVLHSLAEKCPQLEVLRAEHISDFCNEQKWTTKTKLDIGKLASLSRLQELRLRGVFGLTLPAFTFNGSLLELASLRNLHTLSLTSMSALRDSEYQFLNDLEQLKVLELGDCFNWTSETYSLLGKLRNLRHLKLECGGEIPDIGVGEAVSKLLKLEKLELILFAIPASMASSLSRLPNLHTLIVWPHSASGIMPAVVNSHAFSAVTGLQQLKNLTWGVVIQNSSEDNISCLPQNGQNTISMLKPHICLDSDNDVDDSATVSMTVMKFTEKLCLSLPSFTAIKVFNTQIVGKESI